MTAQCTCHARITTNASNVDPTGTTTVRKAFVADVNRRYAKLLRDIREAIVKNDVLGLRPLPGLQGLAVPGPRAFATGSDSEKVEGFMAWLKKQTNLEILSADDSGQPIGVNPWSNTYIQSGYRKGVVDAYVAAKRDGIDTGTPFAGMTQTQFAQQAFAAPLHVDRLAILYNRTYSELKDTTVEMQEQVRQILTKGIADGENPLTMARKISNRVEKIGRTRARVVARTEVISAHAEASLNSFQQFGVEGVRVQAEWSTAGDAAVCELCLPLEGVIMSIREARGLIPRHPNCRCAWIPSRTERQRAGQVRDPELIRERVRRSIQRSGGTKKTQWAAADRSSLAGRRSIGPRKASQRTVDAELARVRRQRGLPPLEAGRAAKASALDPGRDRPGDSSGPRKSTPPLPEGKFNSTKAMCS